MFFRLFPQIVLDSLQLIACFIKTNPQALITTTHSHFLVFILQILLNLGVLSIETESKIAKYTLI